jgi:hypothetical protein
MAQDVHRHQCVVYKGSPSRCLRALSGSIQKKLLANYRCLYLNSPTMIAGLRSYLLLAGTLVTKEMSKGSLVLSSSNDHLAGGRFDCGRMLARLEQAVHEALQDGYTGLWATGDMSWQFGAERDFSKLLEYEWRLNELFHRYPALSGVCEYQADSLPYDVLRQGLLTHPSLYVSDTRSRTNPHYVRPEAYTAQALTEPALDHTIRRLCTLHDIQ